jgi:hypothetical protein
MYMSRSFRRPSSSSCRFWAISAFLASSLLPRLLQTEAPDFHDVEELPCGQTDVEDVIQASSDPVQLVTIITRLMETNVPCGMCIVPCASEPTPDIVYCLFSCMHQRENRCDGTTGLARVDGWIESASVADRDSIIRMLKIVEGP